MTGALLAAAAPSSSSSSTPLPAVRVVLVDPRPERRAVMGALVEHCPGLTVVGLADGFEEAEAQIVRESADVVVVEIQMPLEQGLTTIGSLRERFAELRIIVCSFHDNPTTREDARARGADGYLAKPPHARDLVRLIAPPALASGGD